MMFDHAFPVIARLTVLTLFVLSSVACDRNEAPDLPPVTTVQVTDLNIEVDTIGTLDASRSHTISSSIRGDRGKIIYLSKDGDHVQKGDILARLDPTPFDKEARQQEVKVQELEAALDASKQVLEFEKNQAEQTVTAAEYNLKVAELELSQLIDGTGPIQLAQYKEELEKSGEELARYQSYVNELKSAVTAEGLDLSAEIYLAEKKMSELREKYDADKKQYQSYQSHVLPTSIEAEKAKVGRAEMELRQTQKGMIFKIAKARADVEKVRGALESAKSALKIAREELDNTVIRAPLAGMVILSETFHDGQKRKAREGDNVFQNQPLLYLPDISSMLVHTKIREVDLYKIAVGQQCRIRVDAFPHTTFSGRVKFIGALATDAGMGGGKFFQLSITMDGSDDRLRPGMTARVTISAAAKKRILTIPIHAVFANNDQMFCYQKQESIFRQAPVVLGAANQHRVEVVSGLKKGDTVSLVIPDSSLTMQ